MKMRRDLVLLLMNCLVAAVLLFVIWGEWSREIDGSAADAGESGLRATGSIGEIAKANNAAMPLEAYAEILMRPLFSHDRRPAPRAVVTSDETSPSDIDKLVLTGIVTGPDTKLAIFLNAAEQKELRLREGHDFGGWRLERLAEDSVTFSRAGEDRAVPLYRQKETTPNSGAETMKVNGALRRLLTRRDRSSDNQQQ